MGTLKITIQLGTLKITIQLGTLKITIQLGTLKITIQLGTLKMGPKSWVSRYVEFLGPSYRLQNAERFF